MEENKPILALNPKAPEFFPAITHKPKLRFTPLLFRPPVFSPAFPSPPPPPSHMFYFNNTFPYHPNYTFKLPMNKPDKAFTNGYVKPGKPFSYGFCNRRCIPPRQLKNKIQVHKKRNFSEEKFVPKLAGKTSLMIKNIPNCLGRSDLLRILDNHCRKYNKESSYDFLYLPMDFVKCANLGYAFVNFTSSVAAERFLRDFENFSWGNLGVKKKVCEITVAKNQGKEKLSEHFRNSRFTCHTDDYLPVVLSRRLVTESTYVAGLHVVFHLVKSLVFLEKELCFHYLPGSETIR